MDDLKKWWPIAALLLVGGIIGALEKTLGVTSSVYNYYHSPEIPEIEISVCDTTDNGCRIRNQELFEFLDKNVGENVILKLKYETYQSGDYYWFCEEIYKEREYRPEEEDHNFVVFRLPTDSKKCPPYSYVKTLETNATLVFGAMGHFTYDIRGTFFITMEKIGGPHAYVLGVEK